MQIADCLTTMSRMYLNRIVDSFAKEGFKQQDEDRLREQISQNTQDLASPSRIAARLNLRSLSRTNRILVEEILVSLLEHPESAVREEELYEQVKQWEENVIAQAQEPDVLAYTDARAIDIYNTILEAALEDNDVAPEEFVLLDRLRVKLKITRREHRLLEARLGKFPRAGNCVHSSEDFKKAHKALQTAGILFYCNQADGGPLVVLPEEMTSGVAKALGFEMRTSQQYLLHDKLTIEQLHRALQQQKLPLSGSKQERCDRLIKAGCKPSEVLDSLQNTELGELCQKLQGLKVSGSKQERRDRIIEYFASLPAPPPPNGDEPSDPRKLAYDYIEDLAKMESALLRTVGVIKRDLEMAAKFEEGTRYLFEQKLACPLIHQEGTEHSDGAVAFPDGRFLLWDNKAKEAVYTFPKSHADQFRRYIESFHRNGKVVKTFLVIVPEVAKDAEFQAISLKNSTPNDTDVALITASDLKFVAENWKKHAGDRAFNLVVFNTTGILTRPRLDTWMQEFL